MTGNDLREIEREVKLNGISAVLPANFSDDLLDKFFEDAHKFVDPLENGAPEVYQTNEDMAGILLCVMIIIKYRRNTNCIYLSMGEYQEYITRYCFEIIFEVLRKISAFDIYESATIENILTEERRKVIGY